MRQMRSVVSNPDSSSATVQDNNTQEHSTLAI